MHLKRLLCLSAWFGIDSGFLIPEESSALDSQIRVAEGETPNEMLNSEYILKHAEAVRPEVSPASSLADGKTPKDDSLKQGLSLDSSGFHSTAVGNDTPSESVTHLSDNSYKLLSDYRVNVIWNDTSAGTLQINTGISYTWANLSDEHVPLTERRVATKNIPHNVSTYETFSIANEMITFEDMNLSLLNNMNENHEPQHGGHLGLGVRSALVRVTPVVVYPGVDHMMRIGFAKHGANEYCLDGSLEVVLLSQFNADNWDILGSVTIKGVEGSGRNDPMSLKSAIRLDSTIDYLEVDEYSTDLFMALLTQKGYSIRYEVEDSDNSLPYIYIDNCTESVYSVAPDIIYQFDKSVSISIPPTKYIEYFKSSSNVHNDKCVAYLRVSRHKGLLSAGAPLLRSAVTVLETNGDDLPSLMLCEAKY